jgi:hypothetical protein
VIKDRQVIQVPKVTEVLQVLMDQKVLRVLRVIKDRKVLKVVHLRDLKVSSVPLHKDQVAQQVHHHKVREEIQVVKVHKVE